MCLHRSNGTIMCKNIVTGQINTFTNHLDTRLEIIVPGWMSKYDFWSLGPTTVPKLKGIERKLPKTNDIKQYDIEAAFRLPEKR